MYFRSIAFCLSVLHIEENMRLFSVDVRTCVTQKGKSMDAYSVQLATLDAIAPRVAFLIKDHEVKRGSVEDLWMPSDYEGGFQTDAKIPQNALVALVYNTLTEDGLPSYHRLIATHLGEESVWAKWNGIWTAEESRHGRALSIYLERSKQVRMRAYDEMLFMYHVAGFNPAWESNPYRLLAYTVMQEKATQISHVGVARLVHKYDPVLAQMLGKIASEEDRHCRFYSEAFRLVLEHDPVNALEALALEIRSFSMPGATIPGFEGYQELAQHSGVFTSEDFLKIVEGVIKKFGLREITQKDEEAETTRLEILKLPRLLERAGRVVKKKTNALEFSFVEKG